MHPLRFPILADENIDGELVAGLRVRGLDVVTVAELGLAGQPDLEVLRRAVGDGRVVLTHDADFGTLTVHRGTDAIGIVVLRPGHIDPAVHLRVVDALLSTEMDAEPGFLLVAVRRGDGVSVRLRALGRRVEAPGGS